MSWSDVIYKFAPFRAEVVQDMVRVVHDALQKYMTRDILQSRESMTGIHITLMTHQHQSVSLGRPCLVPVVTGSRLLTT